MTTTTTEHTALSDRAVSYLRTIVPVLWGSIVAQLLAAISPHLPSNLGTALADWLGGEAAIALVTAVAIAAWYWVWRRVEPLIPDWLTRLVLGSARVPEYALTPAPVTGDGAHVITGVDPEPDSEDVDEADDAGDDTALTDLVEEYAPRHADTDAGHLISGIVDTTELTHLALMRDALDEGDPARTGLEKILQQQ